MMNNLPVTIVSGYLGSGKTTYINQILGDAHGIRYAVLVNDFGELNIDLELIEHANNRKISLVNGCVCCTLGNGIDEALNEVSVMADSIDWVLLEASGVALPGRVCDLITNWPGFQLHESIVLVDVTRIRQLVNDKFIGQHIRQQLCQGETMKLSKTELVEDKELQATVDWLEGFRLENQDAVTQSGSVHSMFRGSTRTFEAPISRPHLCAWLSQLDELVVRVKGFVFLEDDLVNRYLLQWVEGQWSLEPAGTWCDKPKTQLVLISKCG